MSKIRDGRGKRRDNVGGKESDHPTSSLQPEPRIVVEGESGGDIEVGGGKDDPQPGDSKSVSRSAVEIRHGQGGSDDKASEGDVDGKRTDQVDPPPPSDIRNKSPISSASRVGESEST